ncbi:MBL fold metallo-hydrolase [Polymorphum gilvum]|uniref:Beta-lactamase domain protein n=1 Tax=Polymorphum gilvum (strain LMG 25793 / CGMCC 1.9160 / SL003B-26A1) TaxID=991905 RepID=F2IZJ5_POLGS|nr:MBL fold metallo-hydrolase [Polymorphum gilvum]ADZ69552.1 Beta-lactamase domain protein [Polymorphum gilvum SL003B-26A1]
MGASWVFSPVWAQGATGRANEGFAKVSLGGADIYAFSDGTVKRPLEAAFVRNAPLDAVQATLAAQDLPIDHIEVPYTPFVIVTGGRHYLIDAGFADNGPAGTGLLHENMRKAGLDPASIDVVLMSHLHGDHINGLRRKDGSLVYPQAKIYIPQPELDHWLDAQRMEAAPEAARGGFRNVRRVLDGYPEDRIVRFAPGDRLEGLFDSIACFGHSPGHTAFALGSGADSFTYLGDVAHYPALFVTNPDWQVQFDMNADAARESRHAMLKRMSEQGGLVGGYHFPSPSLGRITAGGSGYAFEGHG